MAIGSKTFASTAAAKIIYTVILDKDNPEPICFFKNV
jgi:hypothetical protein